MAVSTTPTTIWTGAYGLDKEFDADEIADNATELLQAFIRIERGIWALAARVNAAFFGKSASVAFSSPGWQRPVDAESIFRIENPTPAEVIVVDIDQRSADPARPAVYELGQIFRGAGNAADPSSGNLTFFYAKRPTAPATMTTALDALWEAAEAFNPLYIYECGVYLKLRDSKDPAGLMAHRNRWANQFVAFLEHATTNVIRNYDHSRRIQTYTRMPITSLLTGGPPVDI